MEDNFFSFIKKLETVIQTEQVIRFTGYALVKKIRIDDILCCLVASFPDIYQRALRGQIKCRPLTSVKLYKALTNNLSKTFIFDKNMYIIRPNEVLLIIRDINRSIARDMNYLSTLEL